MEFLVSIKLKQVSISEKVALRLLCASESLIGSVNAHCWSPSQGCWFNKGRPEILHF